MVNIKVIVNGSDVDNINYDTIRRYKEYSY